VQANLTLDRGAPLILEDRFEPARSLDRLIRHRATVLGGAPIILEQLLDEARRRDLRELPLRALALGGAMIPRPLLELALTRYRITPVRMYGSSEVPCATHTQVGDVGEARLRDDGACAAGTELRADDENAGELFVRGPMRFLGYLDEEDNRAALVEGGWFRTGDVGRIEAGRLTVTGRLKEIVSRKGLKISLAEIDAVATTIPGAAEAAAFAVPDPQTGERLAIAIRVEPGPDDAGDPVAALDFDTVVGHFLAAGLAKWKLPEQIDIWDSPLPRTASGKIQRRHLASDGGPRRRLLAPRLRGEEHLRGKEHQ
jgi:acyl-CoA synthetase (AMP-forming)/AMP-acid ligase II